MKDLQIESIEERIVDEIRSQLGMIGKYRNSECDRLFEQNQYSECLKRAKSVQKRGDYMLYLMGLFLTWVFLSAANLPYQVIVVGISGLFLLEYISSFRHRVTGKLYLLQELAESLESNDSTTVAQ